MNSVMLCPCSVLPPNAVCSTGSLIIDSAVTFALKAGLDPSLMISTLDAPVADGIPSSVQVTAVEARSSNSRCSDRLDMSLASLAIRFASSEFKFASLAILFASLAAVFAREACTTPTAPATVPTSPAITPKSMPLIFSRSHR